MWQGAPRRWLLGAVSNSVSKCAHPQCPLLASHSIGLSLTSQGAYFATHVSRYWGGNGPYATSVVAYRSTDGGSNWQFASIIANASAFPASQEGPNENDLAVLSDGKTIIAVIRMDAGDGPETHPYKNYYQVCSGLVVSLASVWKRDPCLQVSHVLKPARAHTVDKQRWRHDLDDSRTHAWQHGLRPSPSASGWRLLGTVWRQSAQPQHVRRAHVGQRRWHGQGVARVQHLVLAQQARAKLIPSLYASRQLLQCTYSHERRRLLSAHTLTPNNTQQQDVRESTAYTSLLPTSDSSALITYGRHLGGNIPDVAFSMEFTL